MVNLKCFVDVLFNLKNLTAMMMLYVLFFIF